MLNARRHCSGQVGQVQIHIPPLTPGPGFGCWEWGRSEPSTPALSCLKGAKQITENTSDEVKSQSNKLGLGWEQMLRLGLFLFVTC